MDIYEGNDKEAQVRLSHTDNSICTVRLLYNKFNALCHLDRHAGQHAQHGQGR